MKFKSDIEIQAGVEAGGGTGSSGQVLSSTGSGVAWIDVSTVIGGPYLPLSAGSSYPLTGDLYINAGLTVNSTSLNAANKLQVAGQARIVGALMVGNSNVSNVAGAEIHIKTSSAPTLRIEDSAGTNVYYDFTVTKDNGLFIDEGTTNRMFIKEASGNVGIGTTNPLAKLDVDGDVFLASRHLKISQASANLIFTAAAHDNSGTEGLLQRLQIKSVGTFFDHSALGIIDSSLTNPLQTTILQEAIASGETNWNNLTLPKESGTFALENWVTSNFTASSGGPYLPLAGGTLSGNLTVQGTTILDSLQLEASSDYITFYGGNSTQHSITSRQLDGQPADDLRFNTYGSFIINLDSNNNQNNAANSSFYIARHGGASGDLSSNILFDINGENGDATFTGDIAVGGTVDGVDISALPTSFAPTDAEANVQSDWNATSGDALILNKPTIPTSFNNLNAVDDRDIAPEDLSYDDDFRIYFAEKSQIEGGSNTSDYQDLLVLNSYTDATGGDANALAFDKNTFRILHYQADQSATNWGTPQQLAYTSEIPTVDGVYLPLAGGTMTGNIAMGNNDITGLSRLAFTDNLRFDDLGADNYLRLTYGDAGPGGLQIYDGDNTLQGYLYADGGGTSSFGLLSGAGDWGVKVVENAHTSLYHDGDQKLFTTTTGVNVTGTAQMDTGITEGIHYVGTAVEHWGDGGTGMSFPSNDTLSLRTASNDRLYITSAGNVGIGTTSPSIVGGTAKMTINVGASPSPVSIVNGTTDGMYIRRYDTNGQYQIQTTVGNGNSGNLSLQTYGGNVGIGTTSPSGKLEVNTGSSAAYFTRTAGDNGVLNPVVAIAADSTRGLIAASGSSLDFRVRAVGTANPLGGSTMMSISSSGNVGIGTTSPGAKLDVNGTIKTNAIFRGDTLNNSANTHNIIYRSGTSTFIAGGDKLVVQDSGNVGIGTASPTNTDFGSLAPKLHVKQSDTSGAFNLVARFQAGGDANDTGGAILINHSNDRGLLIEGGRGGSGDIPDDDAVSHLGLVQSNGTNTRVITLRQKSASNSSLYGVGIGTTTPDARLEVVGSYAAVPLKVLRHGDYGNVINIGRNGVSETANIGYPADSTINLSTAGSERVRIDSSGNVGIGTTAPSQKLHVAGNMRLQNQLYDSTNSLGTNNQVLTKVSAGTQWKDAPVNAQMPDNTAPASAANVGTIRYRSTSNTSFVDVSMQTGATTYTWVNIVSNFW